MPPKILTDEQIAEMVILYQFGKNTIEIAKKFNVSPETVREWLMRSGQEIRDTRSYLAAKLDENYFEKIDTQEKAYWLGFIVADGCIAKSAGTYRSLRLYLSAKDRDLVSRFSKDIGYSGLIKTPENCNTCRVRNQVGIAFNNQRFCDNLINKGVLDWKKNGGDRLFNYIPGALMHHFIRGFFDGDGCISGKYFNLAADKTHQLVMSKLEQIIATKCGFKMKGVKIRKNSIVVGWNGRNQLVRFARFIYNDATRYLQRKKIRFDLLEEAGQFDLGDIKISRPTQAEYVEFMDKYHYMGAGGRRGYAVGAYFNGQLIAVAIIGSITRKEIAMRMGVDSTVIRELARFCIHPNYHQKNFATWFMSRVLKSFSSDFPRIKKLISFADTTQGHDGTIYKASNWVYDGMATASYHYENVAGDMIHKKTVYTLAKKLGLSEKEYVNLNGLKKVKHKEKKRFYKDL